jgi:hypothetical protein
MADYLVYELHPDGTALRSPTTIVANHDAAAYVAAARIVSACDVVVEVWLHNLLIWHLEPSPSRLTVSAYSAARQVSETAA